MAIEEKRGCGYRKVGGLYLVGEGLAAPCDRLPFELSVCPCCGNGIKFTRGFTWIRADLFAPDHQPCKCPYVCPICNPIRDGKGYVKYGLLWVGEAFYSPEGFIREAQRRGISKRISALPHGFKVGATWVMLAHKKAITKTAAEGSTALFQEVPGIFYAFCPLRVEKIITESMEKDGEGAKLRERGITPVVVPDDDPDHNPMAAKTGAKSCG